MQIQVLRGLYLCGHKKSLRAAQTNVKDLCGSFMLGECLWSLNAGTEIKKKAQNVKGTGKNEIFTGKME